MTAILIGIPVFAWILTLFDEDGGWPIFILWNFLIGAVLGVLFLGFWMLKALWSLA